MEENNKNKTMVIDLSIIWKRLKENKNLYIKILPVVFILSCIYIFSLPRYYQTEIKLAPELDNPSASSSLGSIASSFGFDLGEMQTTDAITPLLYPDLMEDNRFVINLFDIKIKTKDNTITTTYHDYLLKNQKQAWWNYPIGWIKSLLSNNEEGTGINSATKMDPYNISKKEDNVCGTIRNKVTFDVDKKTSVITIKVKDQDPAVCRIVADSVKAHLQDFITEYRTNKARNDYEYYKKLTADAKRDYEKTRQYYSSLSDANTRISMKSVELMMEDVENTMQLKYDTYSTLNKQLQASKTKVQEKTPAFTVIKGASVPIKPSGPKRMVFIFITLLFATIIISIYAARDILLTEKE